MSWNSLTLVDWMVRSDSEDGLKLERRERLVRLKG